MVKNLIKSSTDLLFRKQTSILSAATIIATAVLLSRFLGLITFRLLTDRFSVNELGVFFAAFRLPSTIFDIIVMGALTTAFIPVFTNYLDRNREGEANHIASVVLTVSGVVFLVFSVIFFIFTQQLVFFIAPGLSASEQTIAVNFTRIMLVGQTLPLILGNFLTGVLQSHKRFLVPAIAPVAYNLGIIIGIAFLTPTFGLYGAVWGVVFGAILFFLVQIPLCLKLNFEFRPSFDIKNSGVITIAKLIIPRTIGLAFNQLNYTANLIISSIISTRAITVFNFAQQLQQLPVGIFAATISQASLPTLAEESDRPDALASFKKTFLTSLHQILFLVLPAAAILVVLRIPVVRLVYGASKFDWPATVETGRTLAFLGVALVAESSINLLVRGFFALRDSKTPMVIGGIAVLVNILFSVGFVFYFFSSTRPVWSLAFAAAISDIFYASFLLYFFSRRVAGFDKRALFLPALKMGLAAMAAGFCLYVPMKLLDQLIFDTTRTFPLLMLTTTASVFGLSVYLFFTWLLDISELRSFTALVGKARRIFFAAEETVAEAVQDGITPMVGNSGDVREAKDL